MQGLSRGVGAPRGGRQYHSRNSSAHAGRKQGGGGGFDDDYSDNVNDNDNDNTGNLIHITHHLCIYYILLILIRNQSSAQATFILLVTYLAYLLSLVGHPLCR